MMIKKKRLIIIILAVALLLLIPLISMAFTKEVNWDLSDFIVAGSLLLATGLLIEVALKIVKNKSHRIAVVMSIVVVLILIWMELAVGVFGSTISGN